MTNQIEKVYTIGVDIDKVWATLTDPTEIRGWGGGPAKMNAFEDTDFSLWGGDIYGRNIEISAPNYLKQEWYSGTWKEPSFVEFHLTERNGQTELRLIQNKVPENEKDEIDAGWDDYYLGAIKSYLESK